MSKRIAIVGNLANSGYLIQKSLLEAGIKTTLFISGSELDSPSDPSRMEIDYFNKKLCLFWNIGKVSQERISTVARYSGYKLSKNNYLNVVRLIRHLNKKYDFIIGITLGVIPALLSLRPFIWMAMGSDLRQHVFHKNATGRLLYLASKRAKYIITATDKGLIDSIKKLNYQYKAHYFKVLPIINNGINAIETEISSNKNPNELRIFSPSAHIWADLSQGHPGKGNDKLIFAVASLVNKGADIKLKMLKRGPDWLKSMELVERLGIEKYVEWGMELGREQLNIEICNADVIADQFSIGSPGLICLEAMSQGKSVMIYIDENFPDKNMPITNCYSIEEIVEGLIKNYSEEYRTSMGNQSIIWIKENASFNSFGHWLKNIIYG